MNPTPSPEIAFTRQTVMAWEKLRLVYNFVMLIPGVAVAWHHVQLGMNPPGPTTVEDTIVVCLGIGLLANICYCLGPYAEFLIVARGFPNTAQRARWFLFALGMMLSLCVVSVAWLTVEFYGSPVFIIGP